jgi:hypothetical protein
VAHEPAKERGGVIRLACITCVFIALLSPGILAAEGTGTLSGTVAFVEKGKFIGAVKNGTIVVGLNGREVSIKTNENGDFTVDLAWIIHDLSGEKGKDALKG